jgi:hypothetical protein
MLPQTWLQRVTLKRAFVQHSTIVTAQSNVGIDRWSPDGRAMDVAAMELLTGASLGNMSGRDLERVTYEQVLSTTHVQQHVSDGHGGTMAIGFDLNVSMVADEKFAADWIYAANLGADGRAFLAGYSGKVVIVSPAGVSEHVYDIGAVPRHITDAGGRLYILTDTRLYVVNGSSLEALVDVYGSSDVIVADHGFALIEPKAFHWHSPDGLRQGSVRMKDPLRRVISTPDGLVIETRQHRARIEGVARWW